MAATRNHQLKLGNIMSMGANNAVHRNIADSGHKTDLRNHQMSTAAPITKPSLKQQAKPEKIIKPTTLMAPANDSCPRDKELPCKKKKRRRRKKMTNNATQPKLDTATETMPAADHEPKVSAPTSIKSEMKDTKSTTIHLRQNMFQTEADLTIQNGIANLMKNNKQKDQRANNKNDASHQSQNTILRSARMKSGPQSEQHITR